MYLIDHLESQVEQILKSPQKNSFLRCLLRPLVEKYCKSKEIDREIKTGIDIIRLAKNKKSPGDLIRIAIQSFNQMTEEKQKELLLSLMKEEISRIIFNDTTLNLNDTVVKIKFRQYPVQTRWDESSKHTGSQNEPASISLEKDVIYIELIEAESNEEIAGSRINTTLESYYLKLVEIEVQPGGYLKGLILFSSISDISSWIFEEKVLGISEEKVKRIHLLRQYELLLPVKSRLFRVNLGKTSKIHPRLSREYSGFYVKNYLTQKEFLQLLKDRSIIDLSSGKKMNFLEFSKIILNL